MRQAMFACAIAMIAANPIAPLKANSLLNQVARTGLTQNDLNIMVRAGSELYAKRQAVVGDDTIWSNPATGAYGLVEVTSDSDACVSLNYKFQTRRQTRIQTVATRRCISGNRWVLTP